MTHFSVLAKIPLFGGRLTTTTKMSNYYLIFNNKYKDKLYLTTLCLKSHLYTVVLKYEMGIFWRNGGEMGKFWAKGGEMVNF